MMDGLKTENEIKIHELELQLKAAMREVLRLSKEINKRNALVASAAHPAVPGRHRDKTMEKTKIK